ncbi:zf-HC2 domain-containing protein [Streptomyces sp. VRA16 Mangrove soil]|uniref:zf-HC2 domain-containing protein n=1 Tax=Streptomyces sp. VRA16 Mangrove soil TaxID=2817434 RepID=UPI001A9FADFF|nr:zf-HC2 domain-containing protein [Streptomyces sp. VRA16 Mangrove soil]MBO1334029.1 zf-HC2 domain-containing protein [Streptomyces sp. VRA16 Mangrove soil]
MSGTGTEWHVTESAAAQYVDGVLPEPDCWSVERHLEECGRCAVRVSRAARAGAAAPVLAGVRAELLAAVRESEPVSASRVRRPARLLWSVGPALRGPWLLALLVVAAGAVGLAYGAGFDGALPLLLALAPVVPVAGVAMSFGRHADPLHEIAASTPSGGLRLILVRTLAVLAVSLPLLTVAGLLLPTPQHAQAPAPAAWLLPGLALTLAALALGGYVGLRAATGAVGAGWAAAVAVPAAGPPALLSARLAEQLSLYLDGPVAQTGWAAALVACAALIAVRRSAYDHLETM